MKIPELLSTLSNWIYLSLGIKVSVQERLISTFVIIFLLWVVRNLILRFAFKRNTDVRSLYKIRKTMTYIVVFIGFLLVGRIWFTGFQSLSTFLGLLSAGIAIALKDPLADLAGWGFIIWRKPFKVGDRIQIGDIKGDVIDTRIFQFTLIEIGNWVDADHSTGRLVHIPNGKVFTDYQANYTQGFDYIWNEIPILVTFESDWRKAKDIINQIATDKVYKLSEKAADTIRRAANKYMIFYSKLTPIVYTSVKDSGVMLTLRYMCKPQERRSSAEVVWEAVLDQFDAHEGIEFAYPTHRLYTNPPMSI